MMTKRDFEEFAFALNREQPDATIFDPLSLANRHEQWRRDVRVVADVLAASNGRFDRERFYRAAGYES